MKIKNTCPRISDHTEKINDETNNYAQYPKQQPKYKIYVKSLLMPSAVFFKVYILNMEILSGWEGYYEAKSKAFERFLCYSKYIESLKIHHNPEDSK
ncbi:hypothetical protein QE441_002318 [Chryseobacterium sp. SORGH_AS909]|uniref:Uncharacterized protein n=1 Tax=Chryseobacterium camelliae TaxID=1265445 RepID=A0ABU0TE17_9FLAO|nr:hypothetical protein [Chryseobacterium sp. SORGH_AS_1175]MDQ1095237.1 hypothetical protein [Chryseobacterium camelliae]MDQ1099175.1 hypothetical protein [Chryseobacterium sp. SORGH_AS_1048]MDR6086524.1 hypothetical protein [Chryseobacterium sp. SORGH_AS_0909]MDT3406970.1 hypothetical protein [Pseudacidovorax intermedius]MDR6130895.1 hypothetical protein [Chryseobacterium sp. SORGH_AS_1175]